MKHILFCTLSIFFMLNLLSQEDYWYAKLDSLGRKGYVDKKGIPRIPFGQYQRLFTDTLKSIAIVDGNESGIIAINRNDEFLFEVFIVDNGPDYPKEGLFRITENGKIGFANLRGEIVIRPRFDAVFPFVMGMAAFCKGCIEKPLDDDFGEYYYWTGGKWGYIDKKGVVVIPPQYDSVGYSHSADGCRRRIVKVGNDLFELKDSGEVIEWHK